MSRFEVTVEHIGVSERGGPEAGLKVGDQLAGISSRR